MSLTLWCPLAIEARSARRGARRGTPQTTVVRTGMGPKRSRGVEPVSGPVAVIGLGGAVADGIEPGDVVVATEVFVSGSTGEPGTRRSLPAAELVAAEMRRAGFSVHAGPVACEPAVATGRRREELAQEGALAVDMESAWLLDNHTGPAAVVRVIMDTPGHELRSLSTPRRVAKALRTIKKIVPVMERWAEACGDRTVVLVITDAFRERYPSIVGPRSDDVCYATQNRQDAVRTVAAEVDVIIVVGSPNSSNARRLVEVATRTGCRAYMVDSVSDLDSAWLVGANRVGITAVASAPEELVGQVVDLIGSLGTTKVTETTVMEESVRFSLPGEVR